ncbi:uracil-DNA glycosylase [Kocuria sp.]|uniref:uracil-DNA glycosylase n=1 Tax=Kocuria sp. TaxID=1871328 RepID=UPI0026DBEFCC|nr:uracil-DNA glycosylase [Kocuria sp.]MDO4918830.1 uracil-DNA glycosylase [Kocuria sp.]
MTEPHAERLPHPMTGQRFPSPVPPGTGWPEDPAAADTPVAHDAAGVRGLAATARDVDQLNAMASVCRACDRLVEWREEVAEHKRASFAGEPYWGRPVPSYGDPRARLAVIGLAPAANGGNRTGRMFTGDRAGDWIYAALHRAGFAEHETVSTAGDGQRLRGVRMISPVRCAPPANKPTPEEKAACGGWFDREVEMLTELHGMLALGGIAWQTVLTAAARMGWEVPRPRPRFGHGAVVSLHTPDGRDVRLVGCYHVSQRNTFTGLLTEQMLDDALALAAAPLP